MERNRQEKNVSENFSKSYKVMVPKFNEHINHPSVLLKYIILSFPGNMSPESGPGHSKTDSDVFKEYLVERQKCQVSFSAVIRLGWW